MMNMIRNPNLNSSWLFRADILYDDGGQQEAQGSIETRDHCASDQPIGRDILHLERTHTLVRKLVPRSEKRDRPLNQTCSFYSGHESETSSTSLVLYLAHVRAKKDLPFYHPKVSGIGHLHQWNPETGRGTISIHFLRAHDDERDELDNPKLRRVAYHLLEILHKHGQGSASGYVKRVHHDMIIPQARFQNRYSCLKSKYARRLMDTWAEVTDPGKHVFEDLGIAAFLIELWTDMYRDTAFPGFVDIGCGNGLLVHLLTQEGFDGWGFDARARKSWANYTTSTTSSPSGKSLVERLLLPRIVATADGDDPGNREMHTASIHDGAFEPGTFIVSNHADELTPWTPILGALSNCPFIMIPCCSHKLTGAKFRAPPPRDKSKPKSTYASLVDWVSQIAEDCGWEPETEMLRIPSTRNTGILCRNRSRSIVDVDMQAVVNKYGGVQGYYASVAKLVKADPRPH
ncbi:uncharacterized protein UV8b_04110 [Ustilaginoidea virens]|uniref:tRNA (uracil-O(2)-)-methyltransferase n=1 Tax=Ustilaginoidea virens TaxID=1159556 RepID=A0A063C5V0_USTVR|nr:uncharacterized protein UV8b_04110 [Ustilaginoidea virens]QUC19869.1 hypothetical protein UV8b_04110 [Ustilaginoidea virens]GAO14869.1 hypothetical protein UVI_02005930 [Ustilaginoidea virens]